MTAYHNSRPFVGNGHRREQTPPVSQTPPPRRRRPFNPEAVACYAVPDIQPPIGKGGAGWKYTFFVPLEQRLLDGSVRQVASLDDLDLLRRTLADHFGGVSVPTVLSAVRGWGGRDPARPNESREENCHACLLVYAAAVRASEEYIRALRHELEDAWAEGIVLIERVDVTLP
jgi:hypothetical protein